MKLKNDYIIQSVGGLQVAVSPQSNAMIKLSDSGAFIFRMLVEETTEKEIADALCAEYDEVPREELAADLRTFISDLRAKGLLLD